MAVNDLSLQEVAFSYGKKQVLDNITCHFNSGIYGLIGPNGAGKTTLIRLLSGMSKPDRGTVTYGEKSLYELGAGYRGLLGYMPQKQIFYEQDSVYTYLQYMAELKQIPNKKERILELLDKLRLSIYCNSPVNELSGGYRQRVLLAQALLNDPKVLILDEPTAGLDPAERNHFRNVIAERSSDNITIIATHSVSDISYIAKQILIMNQGKLLIQEDQAKLLERTEVYETYVLPQGSTYKLCNIFPMPDGKNRYRIISQEKLNLESTSASLDDVYIDWLQQ